MKRFSLHYTMLTAQNSQMWLPLSFWALFMIIGVIRGQEYVADTTRSYLGAVIPLIGGIMAAYAVLEDPALELRFATPIPAAQTLLERLGPTFLIQVFCAFTFQAFAYAFKADLSILGGWRDVQLAWLVPTLALMALGCLGSLAAAQSITGALLTGMVWIVQLVARGWFAANNIGQYLLVFMSPLMPDHPALRANQITLLLLACLFFIGGWLWLHRQERYI
jgi:hypothetical protein